MKLDATFEEISKNHREGVNSLLNDMSIKIMRDELRHRIKVCWDMVEIFMQNRDPHGIHDMGVEIQALERALEEINKLRNVYES